MAAPTFLQTLQAETMRLQLLHPEREGDLARACALIMQGMVTPSVDDPDTGQVLSSDMQTTYVVNGTCNCRAGQCGRECKHQHGWKLYKFVERRLKAQTPPPIELPQDLEVWPDNDLVETPEPPKAPQTPAAVDSALPEAPVSITLKGLLHGQDCMMTLRGTDLQTVLVQVEAAAQFLKAQQPAQTPLATPQAPEKRYCPLHGREMQRHENAKGVWWSHFVDGRHCKGK